MQINVTNTKTLPIVKNIIGGNAISTLVTEAKLILIHVDSTYIDQDENINNTVKINDVIYKPILISETEKINVNDSILYANSIHKVHNINNVGYLVKLSNGDFRLGKNSCNKILALSEHFSSEQLQMIAIGNFKDGDNVLIECETEIFAIGCEAYRCNHPLDPVEYTCDNKKCEILCEKLKPYSRIKHDHSNHITIHNIEKNLFYTHNQIIDMVSKYEEYLNSNKLTFKEWFKQNKL